MPEKSAATPMTLKAHTEWFHGSPRELVSLRAGSTVTPVLALAKAFSHKPSSVEIQVREDADSGQRHVVIKHNGTQPGYVYRVAVGEPSRDLRQHPSATGAPGEEVLTTRELALGFIEKLPVRSAYTFSEAIE
jgi:hypothetical protein